MLVIFLLHSFRFLHPYLTYPAIATKPNSVCANTLISSKNHSFDSANNDDITSIILTDHIRCQPFCNMRNSLYLTLHFVDMNANDSNFQIFQQSFSPRHCSTFLQFFPKKLRKNILKPLQFRFIDILACYNGNLIKIKLN